MSFNLQNFETSTRRRAEALVHPAETVPAEMQTWNSDGCAKGVVEIVHHFAKFPAWLLRAAEADGYPSGFDEGRPGPDLGADIGALRRNTEELITSEGGLTEGRLLIPTSFPSEPDTTRGKALVWLEWDHAYTLGQVDYVQSLFSDTETHT